MTKEYYIIANSQIEADSLFQSLNQSLIRYDYSFSNGGHNFVLHLNSDDDLFLLGYNTHNALSKLELSQDPDTFNARVLCQDCLRVVDFTESRHLGDSKCVCGGDFYGVCPGFSII